jgi:DNA-binding beta-propeller fold protein YncE
MKRNRGKVQLGFLSGVLWLVFTVQVPAQIIISGNDSKAQIQNGKLTVVPEGEQNISIIDLKGPTPAVKATLPMVNSIFGPPTNIAIAPDESIALVAEAMKLSEVEGKPGFVPSNLVHIVDLQTDPPKEIGTVTVGKQPSGLSISPKGDIALVTNRAETTLSILSIRGKEVTVVGTVDVGDNPTHVVFTPDGKRALVTKALKNLVALLTVDGTKVTYTQRDLPSGIYPYNIDVTPDGKLALVANTGAMGRSDGNVDTITIIDLEADPPRVIDHVVVGDAPEGIAVSPTGKIAVAALLAGSDAPPDAFFYNKRGRIVILGIEGKKVTRLEDIELGGVPEALAFSPDGKWLLVGNLLDKDISVLKVEGTKVTDTKANIALTAGPGAMRGRR